MNNLINEMLNCAASDEEEESHINSMKISLEKLE